jgi:hypothetical protein
VAARGGERHDERLQLLECEDPGAVGGHCGPRGAELALDLIDQVAGERRVRLDEGACGFLSAC